MRQRSYETQFIRLVSMLLLACAAIAGVFVVLSIKDLSAPLKDVALDGQTLANYVALVFGTAVAFAGSWVAIRIAQAANAAQQAANELQEESLRLQDPEHMQTREFIRERSATRMHLMTAVPRVSGAMNAWLATANTHIGQIAAARGIADMKGINDPRLSKEDRQAVGLRADKHLGPMFGEVADWIESDLLAKLNAITPLMLAHLGAEPADEKHSPVRQWIQALGAVVFALGPIRALSHTEALGNIAQASGRLEKLLSDQRLSDYAYVHKLVKTMSSNADSVVATIKAHIDYQGIADTWGRPEYVMKHGGPGVSVVSD
ncbi:hypothetical protein [Aquincola tertiaricarbonis]|uniref:hypothetical protein n=1 Tax=Aquincola tertiaricarbonis TaxID=391953 RepID=UPI000614C6E3|nr:hypothetical protein [Aquincola tertiaricarbonis]